MNLLRTSVIFTKCFSMFFLPESDWFSIGRSSFQLYIAEIFFPEKKNLGMVMDFKKRKIMSQSLRLRLRKSSLYALSEKKLQSPCHGYESCVDITTFLTALSCWGSLPHSHTQPSPPAIPRQHLYHSWFCQGKLKRSWNMISLIPGPSDAMRIFLPFLFIHLSCILSTLSIHNL